jgi:hypothetical protein
MNIATAVQFSAAPGDAMNRLALADPGGRRLKKRDMTGVSVIPISVAIPVEHHEWLYRFARYLNEVERVYHAQHGGPPPKGGADNSRASLAQEGLISFVETLRLEMEPIISTLGDIPDPTDKRALKIYAERALGLEQQRAKSKR